MKRILDPLRAGTLTPASLCVWAGFAVLVLAAAHLAGWREQVTVLSGTLPAGASFAAAQFKAVIYLAAWFGTVVAAPILLMAAGLVGLWHRRETSPAEEASTAESSDRRR
jgi:L-lactate permease